MSIDEKALSNVCKWAEHRGLDWSIAREVVMAYEAAKAPATGQPVELGEFTDEIEAWILRFNYETFVTHHPRNKAVDFTEYCFENKDEYTHRQAVLIATGLQSSGYFPPSVTKPEVTEMDNGNAELDAVALALTQIALLCRGSNRKDVAIYQLADDALAKLGQARKHGG